MRICQRETGRKVSTGRTIWLVAAALLLPGAVEAADVVVNCDLRGSINAALAGLDLQGPHTITVTGTCRERVSIVDRERLTIEAPMGQTATIMSDTPSRGIVVLVHRSRQITLRRLVIAGGFRGLVAQFQSEVFTNSLTSENHAAAGVFADPNSFVELVSARVQNNGGNGVFVGDGSVVGIFGASVIEANRLSGLFLINNATAVVVGSPAQNNRIENNGAFGVILFHSSTIDLFNTNVSGNGATGVRIAETSHAETGGNAIRDNGAANPEFPGGFIVSENSDVFVGSSDISNNTGPGILVTANATLSSVGDNTIGGNTAEGVRLRRHAVGQGFTATDLISGNGGPDLACDTTSLAAGDLTGATNIRCSEIERDLGPPRPGHIHERSSWGRP